MIIKDIIVITIPDRGDSDLDVIQEIRIEPTPEIIKVLKLMKTTMTRRYYVGAESISKAMENTGRCPVLKTLDEALTEAKEIVESGKDGVRYVVEVVKIVRRASQPVIVEDVK